MVGCRISELSWLNNEAGVPQGHRELIQGQFSPEKEGACVLWGSRRQGNAGPGHGAGTSQERGGGSGQVTLSRGDSEQKHLGEALAVF